VVGGSYEALRQWHHLLTHLFEPEPAHHATVALDETNVSVEDDAGYASAIVYVEPIDVVNIDDEAAKGHGTDIEHAINIRRTQPEM